MKKSKVYFEELKAVIDTGVEEDIKKKVLSIFNEFFVEEIPDLIETRKAKSNSACKAIFREQNQKWNSLCDKCASSGFQVLKRDAIKIIVERDITDGVPL